LAIGRVPVTPVESGSPVALVSVPLEGVPSAPPLTTTAPDDPVLIPSAVATPVPRPDTPVAIGRPVALVSVAAEGVPRLGVVSAGEVESTTEPVPVEVVTPVPPFATARVPATVTAPDVAVEGVRPVVPKLMVDTPSTTLDATFTKSLPFQATTAFSEDAIVTPVVGPAPTSFTSWLVDVALMTTYVLLAAGAVIVNMLAGLPVQLMTVN